jgi:hypothetical protein
MSFDLRLRAFLADYGTAVAAALVVISLAAAGGAWYLYDTPRTEQVSETVDRQEIRTAVDHSALVTGNTTLYERGERLSNQPVYLVDASPALDLTVRTAVPEVPVDLRMRLSVRLAAVYDGEAYWESRRILVAERTTVQGGSHTVRTTLNATDLRNRLGEARNETAGVGTLSSALELNVSYETDRYSGTIERSVPVEFTERAYLVDGDVEVSRAESRTVTRTVTRQRSPFQYGGAAVASALSMLLAIAIGRAVYGGIDRERIEAELARQRNSEWISRGELPTNTGGRHVRIDTLEDLVDIAIDSNRRVIHDAEFDAYAVVDENVVYYYAAGELAVDTWLDA